MVMIYGHGLHIGLCCVSMFKFMINVKV